MPESDEDRTTHMRVCLRPKVRLLWGAGLP
jgi:hypothetical protein